MSRSYADLLLRERIRFWCLVLRGYRYRTVKYLMGIVGKP